MVEINTVHGNRGCYSQHNVVQGRAVLPFGKKTLSNERPELGVAQPHGGQIRAATAGAGHQVETEYSVFAAIALRPLHTSLMKTLEIGFADGWYGSAFFCGSDEGSEGRQSVKLFIHHPSHQFTVGRCPRV